MIRKSIVFERGQGGSGKPQMILLDFAYMVGHRFRFSISYKRKCQVQQLAEWLTRSDPKTFIEILYILLNSFIRLFIVFSYFVAIVFSKSNHYKNRK